MADAKEILLRLVEYRRRELRAESVLNSAQSRYWNYIVNMFPQYNSERYHFECHDGENFIVDEETGSEIYYLPNGFKL